MLGSNFEIIYKKCNKNVVSDALSRKDEDVEAFLCYISIIQPVITQVVPFDSQRDTAEVTTNQLWTAGPSLPAVREGSPFMI